jgi:hypothetical protein
LRIDVENVGSTAAGPFVLAGWHHRATAPGPATSAPLKWPMVGLGTAATVSVTDTFKPAFDGARTAWAFVDHGQTVVELNETNNVARYDYAITAAGGSGALAVTAASASPTDGGHVAIAYSLSAVADVEIRIRNVAGRAIARLAVGQCEPGASSQTWTGLSASGARAPAGTYLCEIVARAVDGQRARAVASVRLRR